MTIANGIVTYVTGRVLDNTGTPVKDALVELWHADCEGDYVYFNSGARNPACDPNFAGFGQFLTGSSGYFRFRTIKAGLYNGHVTFTSALLCPAGLLARPHSFLERSSARLEWQRLADPELK
jgi:protocatechuate 3,4-dioxygenase beta subunit